MKYIAKQGAPIMLTRWFEGQRDEQGVYINVRYRHLPSELKQQIHEQLILEQGTLCCYTGRRISIRNSHIEHFLPQNQCTNHEDVAYTNLLAAFGTEKHKEAYGAHAKAGWFDAELLISPLREECDDCFKFDRAGRIKPTDFKPLASKTTIEKLRLDHFSLTEMRQKAIEEALFKQKLGIKNLERVAQLIYNRNSTGQYRQFCFAIGQVAAQAIQSAKRRAKVKQMQNKARSRR